MAMVKVPPTAELHPGDYIDVVYRIFPDSPYADTAIREAKMAVSRDKRWHYQGSKIEDHTDPETGVAFRALVMTVQVADPSKVGESEPGLQGGYPIRGDGSVYEQTGVIGEALSWPAGIAIAAVALSAAFMAYQVSQVLEFYAFERHPFASTAKKMADNAFWVILIVGLIVAAAVLRGK